MIAKMKKVVLGVAALAALAFGGSALAQAGASPPQSQSQPASVVRESKAPEKSATDRDNVQNENGKADAAEKGESAGSEVPGNDGPGGHADEPTNPNANHQFDGRE